MAKKTVSKKKSGGVNKSQAIRDYLKSHPNAGPTEVCKELKKKGLTIAPALVSNVKRAMLGKKRGAARGGRRGDTVSMSALIEASEFVAKVGGIEQAEQILKTLKKLS